MGANELWGQQNAAAAAMHGKKAGYGMGKESRGKEKRGERGGRSSDSAA